MNPTPSSALTILTHKTPTRELGENKVENIYGYIEGDECIQVSCGCTSKKHGDFPATLTIYTDGKFLLSCECHPTCQNQNVTPSEFEKHVINAGNRDWATNIWVIMMDTGEKVSLRDSVLVKHFKLSSNKNVPINTLTKKRVHHGDEFIKCIKCNKMRRFRMDTTQLIIAYHHCLSYIDKWVCSNHPYQRMKCSYEEERVSRTTRRGCPRNWMCDGCVACVCTGCIKCRSPECRCRICVDFVDNVKP